LIERIETAMPPLTRTLLVLAAFSLSAAAIADPRTDRLATTMQRLQQGDEAAPCVLDRATVNADLRREYVQTSILYGGISPQSAYWPEVEALRYEERSGWCPDTAAIGKRASATLGQTMTPGELEAAQAFLDSDVGKKLFAAVNNANREGERETGLETVRARSRDLFLKLEELKERYRKDPR
jgi:hypothetical protein